VAEPLLQLCGTLCAKSFIVALAALAATASFAQSSVTLSGTYSVSYQKDLTSTTANPAFAGSATTAPTAAKLNFGEAKGFAVTDASFKLAAVEDLGGGLKASFDTLFETGAQRGALLTRADSGLGLSGGFGAVAVRNTRTSDLIASIGSAAISLPDGLYDSTGIVSRAAIDTVSYTTPAINGFTGSFTIVENNEGNIAAATTNKGANVIGVAYANGPLAVAAAFKSKPTSAAAVTGLTGKANTELSVSYDFGVAKVAYAFDGASAEGTSSALLVADGAGTILTAAQAQAIANLQTKSGQGLSVTVPMGALTFGANYFKRDVAKVTEIGVSYALSKRTALNVATGKKSGLDVAAGYNGTQNRVQLKHTF